MKYIWLGIKDYCKDCWHDWLRNRLFALYKDNTNKILLVSDKRYIHLMPWKEGNLWHYIQQRRTANKVKKAKGKK